MIKIKLIDCDGHMYVKLDGTNGPSIYSYLFDGVRAESTYLSDWGKIPYIPTDIQLKRPPSHTNGRYILNDDYPVTKNTPKTILQEDAINYSQVIGLYNPIIYDLVEGDLEQVDFEITVIHKLKDFEIIPKKYNSTVSLITQLEQEEFIHQAFPCKISSSQMFEVIRKYVRKNIDNTVAHISSDYEFHFQVVHKITLADPYTVRIDANQGKRNRSPRWVTNLITTKEANILNIKRNLSDSDYGNNCKVAPSFSCNNYKELCDTIDRYLEELMKTINVNYVECSCCKGWGVIPEEIKA